VVAEEQVDARVERRVVAELTARDAANEEVHGIHGLLDRRVDDLPRTCVGDRPAPDAVEALPKLLELGIGRRVLRVRAGGPEGGCREEGGGKEESVLHEARPRRRGASRDSRPKRPLPAAVNVTLSSPPRDA